MKYIFLFILLLGSFAHATALDFLLNGISKPVKVDTVTPANSQPYPFMYLDPLGVRTELGTEATLQDIDASILGVDTTIQGIDFATETTLLALEGKDFATETTLLLLEGKDFATETTLAAAAADLNSLEAKDFATQTTLSAINTKTPALGQAVKTGSVPVVLASDQGAISTSSPVNTGGSQTNAALTATTASTATVPANAVGFIVQAPDSNTDSIRWRVGGTASTTAGMQLQPGRDSGFVPVSANVSICAVASGTNGYEIQWILSQ